MFKFRRIKSSPPMTLKLYKYIHYIHVHVLTAALSGSFLASCKGVLMDWRVSRIFRAVWLAPPAGNCVVCGCGFTARFTGPTCRVGLTVSFKLSTITRKYIAKNKSWIFSTHYMYMHIIHVNVQLWEHVHIPLILLPLSLFSSPVLSPSLSPYISWTSFIPCSLPKQGRRRRSTRRGGSTVRRTTSIERWSERRPWEREVSQCGCIDRSIECW